MLSFDKDVIYTGMTERTSKKTNNKYILVNFLGDTGETFSAMAEGISKLDLDSIKQLDNVIAHFVLSKFNNNINIKVVEINKI